MQGMTNYFHMIHAGHFAFFLERHRNLYRLSQQGWENVNSMSKRGFHHNTQRGGSRKVSSKLLPVFYRHHRRGMWLIGHLEGLFKSLGFNDNVKFEYGKRLILPKFKNVSIAELREFGNKVLKFAPLAELNILSEVLDDYDDELSTSDIMEAQA
jgi:hypothetical protein